METIPQTFYQRAILIDPSALYALIDARDQYHEQAKNYLETVLRRGFPVYITNASLIETYRLILHRLGTVRALQFLSVIFDADSKFRMERMTSEDEEAAKGYVRKFNDQELTLTDAVNFAVMFRMGILTMFGFDNDCYLVGLQKAPA